MPGLLHLVPHCVLPFTGRQQLLQPTRLLRNRDPHRRLSHSLVILWVLLSGQFISDLMYSLLGYVMSINYFVILLLLKIALSFLELLIINKTLTAH